MCDIFGELIPINSHQIGVEVQHGAANYDINKEKPFSFSKTKEVRCSALLNLEHFRFLAFSSILLILLIYVSCCDAIFSIINTNFHTENIYSAKNYYNSKILIGNKKLAFIQSIILKIFHIHLISFFVLEHRS